MSVSEGVKFQGFKVSRLKAKARAKATAEATAGAPHLLTAADVGHLPFQRKKPRIVPGHFFAANADV
jgi:hypothetical protein